MLTIKRFAVENLTEGCVTDVKNPRFSFALESDKENVTLNKATLTVGDWTLETTDQTNLAYTGAALKPFTTYEAHLTAEDNNGEKAEATLTFETGRLDTPWTGEWISDPAYSFTEKKVSPVPMIFRKKLSLKGKVKRARIYATAMGIYELDLNGKKVGDRYFAPGFTSYKTHLQYQTYDVTSELTGEDDLVVNVGGGWAVGSFVFTRVNRVTADRQALLLEVRVTYEDGTEEVIGTDATWDVSEEGPYRMTDIYDGETYDAMVKLDEINWRKAAKETLRVHPTITADYGAPVKRHEVFEPVSVNKVGDELIYNFGQNFAGVISLKLRGKAGQVVKVRHAEILNPDGSLNVTFLRTAKAAATYTCVDGEQEYTPRMAYMGFQYAAISGIDQADLIEVKAVALYSDVAHTGSFECSDDMLNKLQSNITWGARSNFVDIPTDCPQRDERMGWTGDIAVFAPTACYNFDMSRFLEKWLLDVKAEQNPGGGIPNTVPVQGYGFPATMPEMAIAWWGDACVTVPWAEYQARGDVELLRTMYPVMKKFVKASKFWCSFGFGKHRYIWNVPGMLAFGDWIAPDVPQMSQWQRRVKWTGTASLCNTARLTAKVAEILGYPDEAKYYNDLSAKTADAYCSVLTDGNGKLLEEFQTAYVLPIYLNMFPDEATQKKAVENLVALVEKNDYCIGTGFPGTPYILFALADNGREDVAYKMLLNTKCPSWLYEVKVGATTIWERWDGLDENGECPIGDDGTDMMISYNHYASGAVGNFLYTRTLGIEPLEGGYKSFRVKPVTGTLSSAKGAVETPYGTIRAEWAKEGEHLTLKVEVPVGTKASVELPDGSAREVGSGKWEFAC